MWRATLKQENVVVQAIIISMVRGLLGARPPTEVRFFFFFLFVAERPVQLVWMDSRSFAFLGAFRATLMWSLRPIFHKHFIHQSYKRCVALSQSEHFKLHTHFRVVGFTRESSHSIINCNSKSQFGSWHTKVMTKRFAILKVYESITSNTFLALRHWVRFGQTRHYTHSLMDA